MDSWPPNPQLPVPFDNLALLRASQASPAVKLLLVRVLCSHFVPNNRVNYLRLVPCEAQQALQSRHNQNSASAELYLLGDDDADLQNLYQCNRGDVDVSCLLSVGEESGEQEKWSHFQDHCHFWVCDERHQHHVLGHCMAIWTVHNEGRFARSSQIYFQKYPYSVRKNLFRIIMVGLSLGYSYMTLGKWELVEYNFYYVINK